MNRVRSAGPGVERTMQRLRDGNAAPTRHLKARAELLSGITKDTHKNAPRGGDAINAFGERRSAAGEPPAMEYGALFANIDQGVEIQPMHATVIVNYRVLEFGSTKRNMGKRPLGSFASATFKQRVK